MIQRAKNEILVNFLEFSPSDQLDIAYFDNTKWSPQFGRDIAHAGIFENHKKALLNVPNSQKEVFWTFSGVRSVGSTLDCILGWYKTFLIL